MCKDTVILGGYMLMLASKKKHWTKFGIGSEGIISASNCICDEIIGDWILKWHSNHRELTTEYNDKLLKLSRQKMNELIEETNTLFDINKFGVAHMFTDISLAREIYQKYFRHINGIRLIGIGLKEDEYEIFRDEEEIEKDIHGYYGVNVCFNNREVMNISNIIGYDVLGYDWGYFHSYLCNGLEEDIYERLGIKPKHNGLYSTYDEVVKIINLIDNEIVEPEPALWQPWIVCEYELDK
ncbi:hypothetical protein [Vallitalea okinawensis]|uniref:hypothetical protein n=1 Tax=Vallitalea okinawensis TaxID=2078660 RepID=UPI000CFE2E8A|nr:hypothetical protein [Vallitalea okinawensis]